MQAGKSTIKTKKIMKIRRYIYSFMAAATLLLTACSPDDYELGSKDLTAADLAQGIAYTVSVDQATNTVQLKSLLNSKYTVLWTHPQGRSQSSDVTLRIPFGGEYQVTFGVETRGGVVYGEPYSFTLENTNPDLLTDELWSLISGGVNQSKTWVIDLDENGVSKYFVGPLYFYGTDDNWDTAHGSPAPEGADSWNWNADWAGNNWITAAKNFGTMTFDLKNGAHVQVNDLDNGVSYNGTYLLDPANHTISLSDAQILHLSSYDAIVTNWRSNLRLFSLTEHTMQIAALRDNSSEGPCLLVFNFISQDAYNDPSLLPTEGATDLIEPAAPALPTVDDLATKLFTTDINGVSFVGSAMTYLVNADAAYDWLWWNGGSASWESVTKGDYTAAWAPAWDEDAIAEVELTFTKRSNGYTYTLGDATGSVEIKDSKLIFDQEITLFTAANDHRTVALTGKEWTVFSCDPGSELVIGIPATNDADGNVNSYLVANLTYKAIGGGESGPVAVPFNNDNRNNYLEKDLYFRCQLYNPWGGDVHAIDPSEIKQKKNQKLNVTFRLSGFTFTQTAKMVLCCNRGEEQSWEEDCFGYSRAIDVNGDGVYTVSWTNDTGATVNWGDGTSALTMTMQYVGYASLADESEDGLKAACTIESITIE